LQIWLNLIISHPRFRGNQPIKIPQASDKENINSNSLLKAREEIQRMPKGI